MSNRNASVELLLTRRSTSEIWQVRTLQKDVSRYQSRMSPKLFTNHYLCSNLCNSHIYAEMCTLHTMSVDPVADVWSVNGVVSENNNVAERLIYFSWLVFDIFDLLLKKYLWFWNIWGGGSPDSLYPSFRYSFVLSNNILDCSQFNHVMKFYQRMISSIISTTSFIIINIIYRLKGNTY